MIAAEILLNLFFKNRSISSFQLRKEIPINKNNKPLLSFNLETKPSEYTDSASVIRV